MRKLLVLNPNTTEAMTGKVVAHIERLAGAGMEVRGVTASSGPPVIADRASFALGAQAGLATLQAQPPWADAVLLACFGDPGIAALRAHAAVPVIGMAEAALREADALGRPYRVVTAGAEWVPMLHELAAHLDCQRWLDQVVALPTTGLAVSRDPAAFLAAIQGVLDEAQAAGVATVVLGGSGFAGLGEQLRFDGALIDGIDAAIRKWGSDSHAPAAAV